MSRVVGAVAATIAIFCVTAVRAEPATPNSSSFLLFADTNLWRDGAFLDGGLLWSPAGLDNGGFTFKLLLAGGGYTYPSAGLRTDVDGTLLSASLLPGWRTSGNGFAIGVYAGPIVQDYRLTPYDPGSLLRGPYAGGQFAGDVWYQPDPATMVALDGSIASIGLIGSARVAVGWRFGEPFFVGPEAQALWCIDYQQLRFGAHVTAFHIDGFEWTAAAGLAIESLGRSGPYLRIGVNTRY